jgi:hypothetical protein
MFKDEILSLGLALQKQAYLAKAMSFVVPTTMKTNE